MGRKFLFLMAVWSLVVFAEFHYLHWFVQPSEPLFGLFRMISILMLPLPFIVVIGWLADKANRVISAEPISIRVTTNLVEYFDKNQRLKSIAGSFSTSSVLIAELESTKKLLGSALKDMRWGHRFSPYLVIEVDKQLEPTIRDLLLKAARGAGAIHAEILVANSLTLSKEAAALTARMNPIESAF